MMDILFILLTFPIAILMRFILHTTWGEYLAQSLPRHPRFIHWMLACWGSFFWLPCSMCGKKYGGHEKNGYLAEGPFGGTSVCINCAEKAEHRNERMYKNKEYKEALSNYYSGTIRSK